MKTSRYAESAACDRCGREQHYANLNPAPPPALGVVCANVQQCEEARDRDAATRQEVAR